LIGAVLINAYDQRDYFRLRGKIIMRNRKYYVILLVAIMVLIGGCGKQVATNNNTEDAIVESTVENTEVNDTEASDTEDIEIKEPSAEPQEFNPVITEKDDSELNMKDYKYYLEDKTLCTDDNVFDSGVFEFAGEGICFLTTEKVPMYASNGIRTGYIKEDIDFLVIATCGDWCYFYLNNDKRYARLSDIEANSLGPEELDARSAARMAEEMAKAQPQPQTTTPAEQNPVAQETVPDTTVEEPVEVPAESSDKYTPEEAIAVYREIMEAGGMTWDPSLKDVSSWGTGFFYLDKGYAEWAAQSDLESATYGDGVKHFLDKYYLEVTGSDEDCVYFTSWHN